MKEIITILTLLFAMFFGTAFAQQTDFDQRLLSKFAVEELEAMDVDEIKFNTYCIENAFQIMPFPKEKAGKSTFNGSLEIKDLENINFFGLAIDLKEDQYQYFKLVGTDKMLVVKPIFLIKQEL